MKNLLKNIMYGWHQGRGAKYTRQKKYDKALKHYNITLKYANYFGDEEVIALELENMARTLVSLNNDEEALDYAEKSYALYKKYVHIDPMFDSGSKRVSKLLDDIKNRQKK